MVSEADAKIYETKGKYYLYLRKELVNDSNFPFKPSEALRVKIDGNELVLNKKVGRK